MQLYPTVGSIQTFSSNSQECNLDGILLELISVFEGHTHLSKEDAFNALIIFLKKSEMETAIASDYQKLSDPPVQDLVLRITLSDTEKELGESLFEKPIAPSTHTTLNGKRGIDSDTEVCAK